MGTSDQGVALSDEQCAALVAILLRDVGRLDLLGDVNLAKLQRIPELFDARPSSALHLEGVDLEELFERAVANVSDADTYFACLASLMKGRAKFQKILSQQAVPTIEQVGPRGILEYGALPTESLTVLLFWRKWMFDIDNRSAQETGYIYEKIVASAIGGTPVSAGRSPVKRRTNSAKGRQIDCLLPKKAYEIKLRVTIAASGQGRWNEELTFPGDCKKSGYTPVLVVLDSTDNPKLSELVRAFEEANGESYVGDAAWEHLRRAAGATMATFLEKYVRRPLEDLLSKESTRLPPLTLTMSSEKVTFRIRDHEYSIGRSESQTASVDDELPEDVSD